MHETEQYIMQTLREGALGYIPKRAPASELISALKVVSTGDAYLYPSITKKLLDRFPAQIKAEEKEENYDQLTDRELDVLCLIAEGKTGLPN